MLYVGINTGGTFTDLVMMDDTGGLTTAKAATTPGQLENEVFEGLRLLASPQGKSLDVFLPEVDRIGYGTTPATAQLRLRHNTRQRGRRKRYSTSGKLLLKQKIREVGHRCFMSG